MALVIFLISTLVLGIFAQDQRSMFCKTNEDCTDGGTCQNSICQCQDGIYNNDFTKCLKIPSSPTFQCEDTRQCLSILTGDVTCQLSNVNQGFCTCQNGYRRLGNKCIPKVKVGQFCKKSEDCNDGYNPQMSMKCQNDICKCNQGYYERNGTDCRPLSKVGEFCVMNSDCAPDVCNKKSMTCEAKNTLASQKPEEKLKKAFETFDLDEKCSKTEDCKAQNAFCAVAFKKCLCMDGFTFDGKDCVPQIGSKCTEKCAKNAQCIAGTCQCKKYYISGPLNEKCYKLGEFCVMNSDCAPDVCNKKSMTCEAKNTLASQKPEEKLKKAFETFDLDEKCSKTEDCKAQNAFCAVAFKKCLCMDGFSFDGKDCVPQIGSKCTEKCAKNAQCIAGTCQCKKYYISGPLNEKCYKPARGLDESCTHDYNCFTLGDNAFCNNYKCQCRPGFKYDTTRNVCFKATAESDNCGDDSECISKVNSHCDSTTHQCVCNAGYHLRNDICLAELGSKCDRSPCDGDHITCSQNDNICVCQKGFARDDKICIKEVSSLEEECEKDLQCDRILKDRGECVDKKCQCKPDYQFTNETETPQCLLKKYMGDMCRTPSDCRVVLKGEHVVCRNSLCACDYGFQPSLNGRECISGATTHVVSLFLMMVALLIGTRL